MLFEVDLSCQDVRRHAFLKRKLLDQNVELKSDQCIRITFILINETMGYPVAAKH